MWLNINKYNVRKEARKILISEEVKGRMSEAESLKADASKIIEEAKKQVEEMILGD